MHQTRLLDPTRVRVPMNSCKPSHEQRTQPEGISIDFQEQMKTLRVQTTTVMAMLIGWLN